MVGTVKPDVMTYKTADPASWAADDVMRPRWLTSWDNSKNALKERFGYSDADLAKYDALEARCERFGTENRRLEAENARLKRVVADLSLDTQILKDVASGNF